MKSKFLGWGMAIALEAMLALSASGATTNSSVTITTDTVNAGSIVLSNLTASTIVGLDANKKSTSITTVSKAQGGTGADNSAVTYPSSGTVQVQPTAISLTHAGTVSLDFTAYRSQAGLSLTGAVTFATANLSANNAYTLYLTNSQTTNCTVTFPLNGGTNAWIFVGGAPSSITASKRAVLSLSSRSTADTSVWAAYSEEQ